MVNPLEKAANLNFGDLSLGESTFISVRLGGLIELRLGDEILGVGDGDEKDLFTNTFGA